MKTITILVLLMIMFIPVIVQAKTCDIDKISISSITMDNKSTTVTELDDASVNDKNINLNLGMANVGDNVKYKITVKNDSNEVYEVDNGAYYNVNQTIVVGYGVHREFIDGVGKAYLVTD